MDEVRELIRRNLDYPPLLDRIGDDEDLVAAGVNSGEVIRIALACEQYLDRPLTDGELLRMTSVQEIAKLLASEPGP